MVQKTRLIVPLSFLIALLESHNAELLVSFSAIAIKPSQSAILNQIMNGKRNRVNFYKYPPKSGLEN